MAGRAKKVDIKQLEEAVDEIVGRMGVIEDFGKAADHIEGLDEIETDRFGMAVVTSEGKMVAAGEADEPFPLQSISKVFALTIALRAFGDEVWKRVGREPSGDPFNSIVDLERHEGIPRNPFINAGALVIDDMLLDLPRDFSGPRTVKAFVQEETGVKKLGIQKEIVREDGKTAGFSNRALVNLAKAFDNINNDVEAVMKPYVEQCALMVNCRQLALAGRYLMTGKPNKGNSDRRSRNLARRVNAMMLTCGQYDGSGEFAYRVGLPAKSGVGGGILAICPDIASIAVWSPGLDENGNSLLGTLALEQLAAKMEWSVFG